MAAIKPLKIIAGKRKRWATGDFLDLLHGGTGGDKSAAGPGAWYQTTLGGALGVGTLPLALGGTGRDNSGTNVGLGTGVFTGLGTGIKNTAFGYQALSNATSGDWNCSTGYSSGLPLTTGNKNCFYGYQAGFSVTTTTDSVFMGYAAGFKADVNGTIGIGSLTFQVGPLTGAGNIALGYQASAGVTSGTYNFSAGFQTFYSALTGSHNIAIGQQAMFSALAADSSIALGHYSLFSVTNGLRNICLGNGSGMYITTGSDNTVAGYYAMGSAAYKTGSYNVAQGYQALYGATSAAGNVSQGYYAGKAVTAGNYNVQLGYNCDTITTGSSNILIGNAVTVPSATDSNQVNIGNLLKRDGSDNATINATTTTYVGGQIVAPLIKTASYTMTTADHMIVANHATVSVVFSLPAATGSGRIYSMSNIGAADAVADGATTDKINNELTQVIPQWSTLKIHDIAVGVWIII